MPQLRGGERVKCVGCDREICLCYADIMELAPDADGYEEHVEALMEACRMAMFAEDYENEIKMPEEKLEGR